MLCHTSKKKKSMAETLFKHRRLCTRNCVWSNELITKLSQGIVDVYRLHCQYSTTCVMVTGLLPAKFSTRANAVAGVPSVTVVTLIWQCRPVFWSGNFTRSRQGQSFDALVKGGRSLMTKGNLSLVCYFSIKTVLCFCFLFLDSAGAKMLMFCDWKKILDFSGPKFYRMTWFIRNWDYHTWNRKS